MFSIRVLHLAPHFGGGVGAVVRALIEQSQAGGQYSHKLACLEDLNPQMQSWARSMGISFSDNLGRVNRRGSLHAHLSAADIVHLHWWHHPLLNAWMHENDGPAFRCLLWSHVNGHFSPQNFPTGIVDYADQIVLATPWSLEAPALVGVPLERLCVIQSNAGVPAMPPRLAEHSGPLRIGYVGTVDPAKMHPDFVSLCLDSNLDNAVFVVAGGPSEAALRTEVEFRAAMAHFEILGPRQDIPELMSQFDIFGYPLNPKHYGTGEQVLIEAQAAGAVPVVLDNGCERWIVEDGRTGIVCAGLSEYRQALQQLASHPSWRRKLSKQAIESCPQRFSIEESVAAWHQRYVEAMSQMKRAHTLQVSSPATRPIEWLLAASSGSESHSIYQALLDDQDSLAATLTPLPAACFSPTRGSPWHYRSFFSNDTELEMLCLKLSSLSSSLEQDTNS